MKSSTLLMAMARHRWPFAGWVAFVLVIAPIAWGQRPQTPPVTGLLDARPDHFALRNATVCVRPGQRLEHATVVFRNGVITQVGTDLEIPDDAQVLDCTDRYIYPGFIDSFAELDLPDRASTTGYWNTHVTPQRSSAEGLNGLPKLDELREAGFVAQLVAPKTGSIKGTSVVVATVYDGDHSLVLNGDVAMHASLTVPFDGERPRGYPGSPMGAMALVRQALHDAAWYRDAWRVFRSGGASRQPEFNIALEALVQAEVSQMPWIIDASNERFFMRADHVGREFNLPVIVRGSGREYRRLHDIVDSGRGVILPVNFPKAPEVAAADAESFVTLERLFHWNLAPENPGRLANAGTAIAFTTAGLDSPSKFWPELRKAIQRGLDPDAALAALTTTPARWYGIEEQLGTIERGKAASLVISNHDLFAEEAPEKGAIVETWVHGARFRHAGSDQDDLRGTWSVVFDEQEAGLETSLIVSGKHDRLRAKLKIADKTVEADQAQYQQYHLSFSAPGDAWEHDGVARFTLVVVDTASDEPQMGYGRWSDGTRFQFTAKRSNTELPGSGEPGESDVSDTSEESDQADSSDSKKIAAQPGKALFDVTYPLGAYGLDGPRPAPANIVVFKNATVWTCGPTGKLTEADVILENGRIQRVGHNLAVPEGAQVVPCDGKHITPGIIDCHSHIATDGGINEGTQAITAEVRIGDFIDADDISIYRQLAGGVTSANILHGSANPIGGQNQVIKLRWGSAPEDLKFRDAPAGIKFALGENVKQSNWGDRFNTRYPQSRMGVGEIIDDAFRRAAQYDREHAEWQRARKGLPPRVDLELAALAEVLAGSRWIHCHSYQQSEILTLMKICDQHNVQIGTFQHVLEGYKVADEMARRGIMASAFSDWWAYKFEVYDAIPYAGALMHEAGVVVSFNSDDPEMGRRLNLEAAKAIQYGGIAPEEALKFVTLNPARQLRIDPWVGSLEPGKHADLVVWSGDPLSTRSRCEQTWIDGTCYFDLEENARLEQRDARRFAELVQLILSANVPTVKSEDEEPEPDSLWPRMDEYCHGHPHS